MRMWRTIGSKPIGDLSRTQDKRSDMARNPESSCDPLVAVSDSRLPAQKHKRCYSSPCEWENIYNYLHFQLMHGQKTRIRELFLGIRRETWLSGKIIRQRWASSSSGKPGMYWLCCTFFRGTHSVHMHSKFCLSRTCRAIAKQVVEKPDYSQRPV